MRTAFEARACTILYNIARTTAAAGGVFLLPADICPVVPLALLAAQREFELIDIDWPQSGYGSEPSAPTTAAAETAACGGHYLRSNLRCGER